MQKRHDFTGAFVSGFPPGSYRYTTIPRPIIDLNFLATSKKFKIIP